MEIISKIEQLFENHFNNKANKIELLPQSGSNRSYYRITSEHGTYIASFNEDVKENNAFFSFTNTFKKSNLAVPEVFCISEDKKIYIQEDLGDTTLFGILEENRSNDEISDETIGLYKKVLKQLPNFQINGGKNIDYSNCYPRANFDKQSMMWDLNYFKYYFLKLAGVVFDEQKLEDDFQTFTNYLLTAESDYFLYRDFQSRNIMIKDNEPYFIDYQGGRKGALQYDLASLLYDAKANLPEQLRKELLNFYIEQLGDYKKVDKQEFLNHYYGFVLIRIMQAMGAYGFRGFYEKKEHFLLSIPYALSNLENILKHEKLPIEIPTLWSVLKQLTTNEKLKNINHKKLHIQLNSFSFKKGIPQDLSGNGGGFVFDCRFLPNPGRYDEYKTLNGKDKEVIEYLEKEEEVGEFLTNCFKILDKSVAMYVSRNFSSLMINFGCTGGQHRSVYCAEQTAKHLKEKFDVKISLKHVEQDK